ncbi:MULTISPECIES: YuzD family protein [Mesobacillus]|uniref:Disulfide oxidoreductase n=2 Tax=Mesobacillus TaxID=2675231 RepID=A0A0D6ZE15_9BACI|nr:MULTISPECIES: YuzD family protein [Mesobacillus]KIY23306.1 disulfide oxidoreductase [Mesobacillus subterraneus]MDQ0412674.1 disulfide oxidoreductase YuzD [Mesobacillus stamsii]
MECKEVEIVIYGAEVLCSSCINLPSSKETSEWLEAAISRKYKDQPFKITYVDIHNPPSAGDKKEFAEKVIEENMFYPVVLIEGKIVGEGNPKLKNIYAELEKYGYIPA